MSTIAARPNIHSGRFLPFDEEESIQSRTRSRHLIRSWVTWLLLPALVALVGVGSVYAAQTAHATALTYQIAALRAQDAQLQLTAQEVNQELQQKESAGAIEQAAVRLGLAPPTNWVVVTPASSSPADPLTPVLVALRHA